MWKVQLRGVAVLDFTVLNKRETLYTKDLYDHISGLLFFPTKNFRSKSCM